MGDDGDVALPGPKARVVLAVLLLRPNDVVSIDRLAEELWGDRPPATAVKVVQLYVSQLRKALGDTIVTRSPGYLLAVGDDDLDATRFRRLVAAAHTETDATRARRLLAEALALWRGPVLADVELRSGARTDADALEALRVATLEERIEADLAVGAGATVVPELEALVAAEPLRERPRAQLMLALHRAGRRSDALALFRATRSLLADELGLEPSEELRALERRVLQDDPSLHAPATAAPPRASAPAAPAANAGQHRARQPRRRLMVAAAVTAFAIAAALFTRDSAAPVAVFRPQANSLVRVDPVHGVVEGAVPVGPTPVAVAAGSGSMWTASGVDAVITRIDARRREVVAQIPLPTRAVDLAWAAGYLWAAAGAAGLAKVDPYLNRAVDGPALELGSSATYNSRSLPVTSLAVSRNRLTFTHGLRLSALDARTGNVVRPQGPLVGAGAIAAGSAGEIWAAAPADGTVTKLSASGRVLAQTAVAVGEASGQDVAGPGAIAVGGGAVWAALSGAAQVWRLDETTGGVVGIKAVGRRPVAVTYCRGAAWTANFGDGTLSELDGRTGRITRTIDLGRPPSALACAYARLWVAVE